jgi:hypothetical protein
VLKDPQTDFTFYLWGGGGGQCHTLAALPLQTKTSTHHTGSSVGPRAYPDRCGKFRFHWNSTRGLSAISLYSQKLNLLKFKQMIHTIMSHLPMPPKLPVHNQHTPNEISCSHSSFAENLSLLGCDVALLGGGVQHFKGSSAGISSPRRIPIVLFDL